MANSLKTQIITDGPRNATVKVTGVLDTSDLAYTVVVNPASFSPVPFTFRLFHIDYSMTDGIEIQISWDATTPSIMLPVAGRGRMSFIDFGGLINDLASNAPGYTGGIGIKTTGYPASTTQVFSLVFELVKQGPDYVGVK